MQQTATPRLFGTFATWARRTTTSFAELRFLPRPRQEVMATTEGLVYRLKHWPDLANTNKTAGVYRTLSMMSHRPVNRHWILAQSGLPELQVDRLLRQLVREGAVDVIDTSGYAAERLAT